MFRRCLRKVSYLVDFGKHGKLSSGHGHVMSIPGNLGSGHLHENHAPFSLVLKAYLAIPSNINYAVL